MQYHHIAFYSWGPVDNPVPAASSCGGFVVACRCSHCRATNVHTEVVSTMHIQNAGTLRSHFLLALVLEVSGARLVSKRRYSSNPVSWCCKPMRAKPREARAWPLDSLPGLQPRAVVYHCGLEASKSKELQLSFFALPSQLPPPPGPRQ